MGSRCAGGCGCLWRDVVTFEHILAFNIALVAAIVSPGPALLVAIRTTLSAGRPAGIAVGAGLAFVAAMWTLAALLGLETVFRIFPWAYTTAKIGGTLYLLFIAYKMWTGARQRVETTTRPTTHAFRQGMVLNLLNPKSVLFSAAVLIVIFPANMTLLENTIVVFNHLVVEISCYTFLAFVMSTNTVSDRYLRAKVYIDRIAAVVLGLLGIRLTSDQ
jgi:threonine/homoserine/homoserine lactone efflux protein